MATHRGSTPCFSLCSRVLAFAALIGSTPAFAESIGFNEKVTASMAQGLEACGVEAQASAERNAVRRLAEKLNAGRAKRTDRVADQARDCCVVGSKFLQKPKDLGNGQCKSVVRVLVSEAKVKSALRQHDVAQVRTGQPRVVGAVIRYFVDGKPVDASKGYNPLDAIAAFESELQEYGFRTTNLTVLLEDFSLQRFGETCAIDGETMRDCSAFESYASAVQTVLDRTRWARHNNIPDVKALGKGGWVAIGEVKGRGLGRDPASLLYRADAHTTIRLYRISDGRVLSVQPDQSALVKGDRQHIAIHAVTLSSVGKTAARLAVRLHEYDKSKH